MWQGVLTECYTVCWLFPLLHPFFFQITGDPCDLIGSYRCDLFSLVANLTNFYDLAAKDGEIGDH